MATTRQQITALLKERTMDARDLSQALGIKEKEVYGHLGHIKRSVSRQNKALIILPGSCLSCNYEFKGRSRFTPPGRCPRCRKTHIQSPAYRIE